MSKTYKIATIKDIFAKVPADRIPVLMAELSEGLVQAKSIHEGLCLIAEKVESTWPDFMTWVDDGRGEVKINVKVEQK